MANLRSRDFAFLVFTRSRLPEEWREISIDAIDVLGLLTLCLVPSGGSAASKLLSYLLVFSFAFPISQLAAWFFEAASASLISSLASCSAFFVSPLASASGRSSWIALPSETGESPVIFAFN